MRKRLALYTTALSWFVGVYVLWLGPLFLVHSAVNRHGFFGPTSSVNFWALWWIDYWQDAPVNLRFHTLGVAFTLAFTIALTWFCISLYRSWSTATPIRIQFWPSLREHRLRRGECPRCGYQLAGRATRECSECGWHPPSRPRALVIKDGRIASHLRCIKCKYVLKGMAEDAACPECGCAVSDSIEAGTAAFPWTWFQRGVSGAAILIGVVLPILNVILYQSSLRPGGVYADASALQFAWYWFVLGLGCMLVFALAAFHRRVNFWCLVIVSIAFLEASIAVIVNMVLWWQHIASA